MRGIMVLMRRKAIMKVLTYVYLKKVVLLPHVSMTWKISTSLAAVSFKVM